MEIVIRKCIKEDIPHIIKTRTNSIKSSYKYILDDNYLNNINMDIIIRNWTSKFNNLNIVVALIEDKIIGFCKYNYSSNISLVDSEITDLYVEDCYKRKGIGTKLFKFALNDLVLNNKNKVCL